MIRKDQLPNIWGDEWRCTAQQKTLEITSGHITPPLILCNYADWPMFMLTDNDSYTVDGDDESNIKLIVEKGVDTELYRIQGMNTPSNTVTNLDIIMEEGSKLKVCTITLGGQHVRNNVVVRMQGERCSFEAGGLYLLDREQQCDNYIFVEHACPNCSSHELYKGIIDDSARARFNGHVLVQDGACKTEAHQTNRNILLTDKAHVDTRPFLEIYNDDVKCSHGSTIGQLDEQALFYLQTRCIPLRTAKTMLSYAFCDEVIRYISIPNLREAVGDVIKKRLHGELTPCIDCALQCSTPCNGPEANFKIDVSKL